MTKTSNIHGFSMIGMVISVVIIALMSYFLMKTYFGGPSGDVQTEELTKDAGGYPGMVHKADDNTNKFNKEAQERINDLNNIE